jgi:hypothetical protein
MSAKDGRRGRFDFPNAFIVIWMVAMFVAFGLFANLIDQYGILYNLGQGLFIALFVGTVLFLVKRYTVRRTNKEVNE